MATEEARPVVAFLGPVATYTHQATLNLFSPTTYTLTPTTTIEDVFATVHSTTATRGVVPFENSSNGSVVLTLDLFADLEKKYPDILVCGETYVRIEHCLVGRPSNPTSNSTSNSTLSNSTPRSEKNPRKYEGITKLYSHPQAWGQCKQFLTAHFKATKRQDCTSTAEAAALASRDEPGTSAAVCSKLVAERLGLDVLARGIEDRADNTTRFLVLRKRDSSTEGSEGTKGTGSTGSKNNQESPKDSKKQGEKDTEEEQNKNENENANANWKSLITFTIDHRSPGALARCLAVFSRYGINLTSINTRPSGTEPWNYIFFVEIQGRREEGGKGDVNRALKELDGVGRGWRWVGSWENGGR